MAACCGKSTHTDQPIEEPTETTKGLPENAVPLARVHRLLDTLSQEEKIRETPGAARARTTSDEEEDEAEDLNKKALQRSSQI